jgi:flagellar P-ring protein precursor FlgI
MGKDVRVSTVAVAQGNLTVTISEQPQVSQPNPLAQRPDRRSCPAATSRSTPKAATSSPSSSESVTLRELVDGLNALGIGPRDLISILQAIKAAGALQADIEVM